MTVKLYEPGLRQARQLIAEGKVVRDERDDWSEHQPGPGDENAFIERHGIAAFGRWHLGADDEHAEDTKGHYKFPYGDFRKVHRCALLAAEVRASQYRHPDIAAAAHELHRKLEKEKAL
jgi:hypothetical protein